MVVCCQCLFNILWSISSISQGDATEGPEVAVDAGVTKGGGEAIAVQVQG